MKIIFVGLSNKPGKEPFDASTNSGKVVDIIIKQINCDCFKVNLVNFAPLDQTGKLRYPTKTEIIQSKAEFLDYTYKINPDLIISFGSIVSNELRKIDFKDIKIIYKQHPSYIYIYKRKKLDSYIDDIVAEIKLVAT